MMSEIEEITAILNRNKAKAISQIASNNIGKNTAKLLDRLKKLHGVKDISFEEWQERRVQAYNDTEGNLNKADGYDCRVCRNKGLIERIDNGYEVTKECDCMKIRKSIRLMRQSGLEKVIKQYTLDKYTTEEQWQRDVLSTVKDYIRNGGNSWLFIGGSSGSGKTHLCTAVCREFLLKRKAVKYMTWLEEAKKLKYNTDDAELEYLKAVDVLYIDDLFKTANGDVRDKPTPADVRLAFEIIDYRKNNNLITIISNERYLDEIVYIDEALGSRIAEMCGKYFISIKRDVRKNYRLRKVMK